MKAIVQKRYGSIDELRLREVAKPVPGEDDVLVRVHAASLHPDVWHVVTGRPYLLRLLGAGVWRPRNPVPGTDMAGIVESAGKSVTRFQVGEAVFGETATSPWSNGGAFAEYVSVPQDRLAVKPDNVTFEEAAAASTAGIIALNNLRDTDKYGPGRKILVNGGGGGVGSLAIQFAKARGAHVTAVDRASKLAFLRELGADEVIDFEKEDFTRRGVRYDVVFDVPGERPFSDFRRALLPDGRYVPIGHDAYGARGRRVFGLVPHFLKLMVMARLVRPLRGNGVIPKKPETMARLRSLLEAGTIRPVIAKTYPLSDTVAALRHMIGGEPLGRIVITMGS